MSYQPSRQRKNATAPANRIGIHIHSSIIVVLEVVVRVIARVQRVVGSGPVFVIARAGQAFCVHGHNANTLSGKGKGCYHGCTINFVIQPHEHPSQS